MNRPARRPRRPKAPIAQWVLTIGDTIVLLRDALIVVLGVVVIFRTVVIHDGPVDPLGVAAGFSLLGLPLVLRSEERDDPNPDASSPPSDPSPREDRSA